MGLTHEERDAIEREVKAARGRLRRPFAILAAFKIGSLERRIQALESAQAQPSEVEP